MPLRPLEYAAGAGQGERLLFAPPLGKIRHARGDGGGIVSMQAKPRARDHQLSGERQAGAVAKLHGFARENCDFAVHGHARLFQHIANLPAISARVHRHRAAHTAGDARREFQPGKSRAHGLLR